MYITKLKFTSKTQDSRLKSIYSTINVYNVNISIKNLLIDTVIWMAMETTIKTTSGRWHGGHLYKKKYISMYLVT